MEIAPDVHAVPLLGATGYLLADERLTLIDTGLPGSRRPLLRYLARIGRAIDELARVVITHCHPDHAGAVGEVAGEGVEVLMHPADIERVRVTLRDAVARPSRGHLFASLTRAPSSVAPVEDGALIPTLGGLRVIHTPGHTPGSICLFLERQRLLFVGDALEAKRRRVSFASPIFSDDMALARRSVKRMAELDVETIAFGHFPPWRDDARGVLQALAGAAESG
ncbi:MAG TPA: MBL fold metallo-hydrolase [Candidatus Limnocylindrales bacterium]|nr:MBL fold metallo-hydrolase [Candidatus Limnocylindrales bacterium]